MNATTLVTGNDLRIGRYAAQVGAVAALMMRSEHHQDLSIASLNAWIRPPILLEQIGFFLSNRSEPMGYVTWGFVAPDVEHRLETVADATLHYSEWNEGRALWFFDLNLNGLSFNDAHLLIERQFPNAQRAKFLRRRVGRPVAFIWRRRSFQISSAA